MINAQFLSLMKQLGAIRDGGVTVINDKVVARENGRILLEGHKKPLCANEAAEILARAAGNRKRRQK